MLFWILQIAIPPIGAPKKTWDLYKQNIDEASSTFTCFDGSKTISLELFNDGFADCPDSSDEPSTGIDPNSTFWCRNELVASTKIKGWSVGDGICDCCDGSDEFMNPRVNCPNTCGELRSKRDTYAERITSAVKKGLAQKAKLESVNRKVFEKEMKGSEKIDRNIAIYQWLVDLFGLNNTAPIKDAGLLPWQNKVKKLWEATFKPAQARKPSFIISLKSAILKDLTKWNNDVLEASKRLKTLREIEQVIPAAVGIYRKKYAFGRYTLKFMDKVTQGSSTNCGYFQNITGNTVWFDNGDYCWRTSAGRSLELELRCSDDNRLLNIEEQKTCRYTGVFLTPAVCNASMIEGLGQMKLSKLEKMMNSLGIDK